MEEPFEEDIPLGKDQVKAKLSCSLNLKEQSQRYQQRQKSKFLDPPRQLPNRSYSLQPDMINGWKPKGGCKANLNNVFSISYEQEIADEIVRQLYKSKKKSKEKLVYLGPRRTNSYVLHENKSYPNPYPLDKRQDQMASGRRGIPLSPKLQQSHLKFDSDFEGGNLDAAVQRGEGQFDLFMRVDTNTRGHTNWYYFSVSNGDFIGTVRFSICNFRRQKSLYQRGLKPYVYSKLEDSQWHQGGKMVTYERKRPKYEFLYDEQDSEDQYILNTHFAMSFSYDFAVPQDTVYFAYCIPYTYTRLLRFLSKLENTKKMPVMKTLSGLTIPILQVTDQNQPQYNKQVVLVTGRVHPGESNASFMAEGVLSCICGNDAMGKQLRKGYIFYVVPMLNPDGVVAGNYRTSLFGKDLNRTFNQSRKYAFPQTFHLVEFTKQLKSKHKKRFNLYIDLHGHSVKKNVFMYGPEFSIQQTNYELSREFPRLLGGVTSLFRYYSCIFRISGEKATTARAILNRKIDIAFTYTMEASNGFYVDATTKMDVAFTSKKFKEMGVYLCKGLSLLKFDQSFRIKRQNQKIHKDQQVESGKISDDEISEGKSDSEPENEDLSQEELLKLEEAIKQNQEATIASENPAQTKSVVMTKFDSRELHKSNEKVAVFLPPIKTTSRAAIFSDRARKKHLIKQQRLKNIESQVDINFGPVEKPETSRPRYSLNQMASECRNFSDFQPQRVRKEIISNKHKIIVSKQMIKW